MTASTGDYRSLLSGGLWFTGTAAVVAALYGITGGTAISLVLGYQFATVAFATWAARDLALHRQSTPLPESQPPNQAQQADPPPRSLISVVQSQVTILGGASAIIGLLAALQLLQQTALEKPDLEANAVLGIVSLIGAFLFLVLARSFQAIPELELPEAAPLTSAFREAQWASLIAAIGTIGSAAEPRLEFWCTRMLLVWTLIVCLETSLHLLTTLLIPPDLDRASASPIRLLSRDLVFTASNPVTSLIQTVENRCGVSLGSSWAISFVCAATLPLVAFLLLLGWGLTSIAIVETHQFAVREHLGRTVGDVLKPGLHFKLPWPFGRIRAFPVKTVQQRPIGFVEDDETDRGDRPRALLWTKPHAKEELALALGNGTELVAVNALVYYKIAEDRAGFLDYVYQQSSPDEALVAFAYRALMEETRGRTLDDVLSVNRAAFSRRVVESVRRQAAAARLGLDVVDLALLNLHPPIDAGGGFLEVINARLDAKRRVIEAEGEKQVALLNAKTRSAGTYAAARVEERRRIASALGDMAEFKAVGQGLTAAPRTFRMRLWIQAIENALSDQRLFLVDRRLLDEGSELMLDMRPVDTLRSPLLNAPSPFPTARPNQND